MSPSRLGMSSDFAFGSLASLPWSTFRCIRCPGLLPLLVLRVRRFPVEDTQTRCGGLAEFPTWRTRPSGRPGQPIHVATRERFRMSVGQDFDPSLLERKDRSELVAIATSLGEKPPSRLKKADIVALILRLVGAEPGDEVADHPALPPDADPTPPQAEALGAPDAPIAIADTPSAIGASQSSGTSPLRGGGRGATPRRFRATRPTATRPTATRPTATRPTATRIVRLASEVVASRVGTPAWASPARAAGPANRAASPTRATVAATVKMRPDRVTRPIRRQVRPSATMRPVIVGVGVGAEIAIAVRTRQTTRRSWPTLSRSKA